MTTLKAVAHGTGHLLHARLLPFLLLHALGECSGAAQEPIAGRACPAICIADKFAYQICGVEALELFILGSSSVELDVPFSLFA
jgi:hypothetical protein